MTTDPVAAMNRFAAALEASVAASVSEIEARPKVEAFRWDDRGGRPVAVVMLRNGRAVEGFGGGRLDALAELVERLEDG